LAVSLVGCATPVEESNEDGRNDGVVASFSGWELSRDDFRAEFVRTRGDSAYAASDEPIRIEFANLLLNKEILLLVAGETCSEPDPKRQRLDRVLYEKNLLRRFVEKQGEQARPNPGYLDSLTAANLAFHEATFPLVRERFGAYWDSIRTARRAGVAFNVQEIVAPIWLFSATEQMEPVFALEEATGSVADFVLSLDSVDVDFWPTRGDSARVNEQIKQRVRRLFFVRESERLGVDEDEQFRAKMGRVRELHLLDQFRDRFIRTGADLTETDLRGHFDRHMEFYRAEERGRNHTAPSTSSAATDDELFAAVRSQVERNALEEWVDLEIDRVIVERRDRVDAQVHDARLRDK